MFGITENGDASINYEWTKHIDEVDGTILITKKLTTVFRNLIAAYKHKPFILHVSCTGYGKTVLEPNLDTYQETIDHVWTLINCEGFPADRIVLRIDPIIATAKGIKVFESVVTYARRVIPEVTRIRVSVLDMYPHVRRRFEAKGMRCPYGDSYQPADFMFDNLNRKIEELKSIYPMLCFESCAETKLPSTLAIGCVSLKDYDALDLPLPEITQKGQRKDCLCLGEKKDLLKHEWKKTGYNHCYGCLYCYWKTEKDDID